MASTSSIVALVARIMLGGLFVVAGVLKLMNLEQFQRAVDGFYLLPFAATALVASYLPWLECGAGLVLVAGRWGWQAAWTILMMLTLIFMAVLVSALVRGINPECGCFGAGTTTAWEALIRNGCIVAIGWCTRPTWQRRVRQQETDADLVMQPAARCSAAGVR